MSKRSEPQGIQTSLYLTAKRQQILSKFHLDFRQAVYKLIDQAGAETSEDAPQPPISAVEAPKDVKKTVRGLAKPPERSKRLCDRCARFVKEGGLPVMNCKQCGYANE
jgi:hypothetical protein